MVAKEVFQQVSQINKDGTNELKNYVGEWPNMITNVSNSYNEQMKGVKERGLYSVIIVIDLAPKTS